MQHILISEAQHGISTSGEKLIPISIILLPTVVRPAVQFDNEARLMTTEISDIPSEGVLFPESQTVDLATAQSRP